MLKVQHRLWLGKPVVTNSLHILQAGKAHATAVMLQHSMGEQNFFFKNFKISKNKKKKKLFKFQRTKQIVQKFQRTKFPLLHGETKPQTREILGFSTADLRIAL